MIKDSGERRVFESGGVRDIQTGKGACWLLPLEEIYEYLRLYYDGEKVLPFEYLVSYIKYGYIKEHIYCAVRCFADANGWDYATEIIELSKHFEEGAAKYNINNWCLGLNTHCYVDSAIRHYLKWLRGDKDESHDRAFVWNLFCLLWTVKNRPEFNDLDSIETVNREKVGKNYERISDNS